MKRRVKLAVAAGLLTVGVASPAFAAYEQVGGGEWWYGVSVCCNYSDYLHPSTGHGSSVSNGNGAVSSDCEPGGVTAEASQSATWSGNKAYWRHC
ncbi:lactococcin 972 family bacteriocin [Micromonospora sp. WMMD708]|uniref:lactococcin 972 family bacteriocin n=1 Tax=Micromonospora sp. WMMD708 TaxID=3403464 RepID=UPI003BF5918F